MTGSVARNSGRFFAVSLGLGFSLGVYREGKINVRFRTLALIPHG